MEGWRLCCDQCKYRIWLILVKNAVSSIWVIHVIASLDFIAFDIVAQHCHLLLCNPLFECLVREGEGAIGHQSLYIVIKFMFLFKWIVLADITFIVHDLLRGIVYFRGALHLDVAVQDHLLYHCQVSVYATQLANIINVANNLSQAIRVLPFSRFDLFV